ncbi:SDR family NAD(P)-dependent oxidoreductase [Streptomyces sp. NPDC058469]|uniref:SDR family NAD(P)-dependent oxidoreductase n=1 Tax=Streptomyces sp. NPDC058469 TaxID=3346514 RepID=UPI003669C399
MVEAVNVDTRQTALVTGATSGIGRAAALALAADGFYVFVHGRDAGRGAATIEAIELTGGHGRFVAADLTDVQGVRQLAAEVGEVDVLVNNGGISWFGATPDLDPATFDAMFATNVRAAYYLVAALAPAMAKRGGGSIISLSSMAGKVGLGGGAAYSASKVALEAMTRAWAAEFSPAGVRVNAIAPGPTFSDGADSGLIEQLATTTLMNRGAKAEEIGDAIAFLASPKSAYVTGTVLAVDGGRTAV